MIVAIQIELLEPYHESLKDGVCLKSQKAIKISFVFRDDFCSVNFPVCGEKIRGARTQIPH